MRMCVYVCATAYANVRAQPKPRCLTPGMVVNLIDRLVSAALARAPPPAHVPYSTPPLDWGAIDLDDVVADLPDLLLAGSDEASPPPLVYAPPVVAATPLSEACSPSFYGLFGPSDSE